MSSDRLFDDKKLNSSVVAGKKLDKEQQISNWSRRPLSAAQLQYAAADAQCQVLIYDRMVEKRIEAVCVAIGH